VTSLPVSVQYPRPSSLPPHPTAYIPTCSPEPSLLTPVLTVQGPKLASPGHMMPLSPAWTLASHMSYMWTKYVQQGFKEGTDDRRRSWGQALQCPVSLSWCTEQSSKSQT
jgi:hypothetical protein